MVKTPLKINVARNRFEQSGIEVKGVIFNAIEKSIEAHIFLTTATTTTRIRRQEITKSSNGIRVIG
ncbi:hypothetical protein O9929_00910 [Vibrio lentus]|nr:hypothetical protein [Vibrio lentus]